MTSALRLSDARSGLRPEKPERYWSAGHKTGPFAPRSGARRRALEEVTTRRALHVHARGGTGVTEGLSARRSAHGTRWPWWLVGLLGSFRALRH